MTSSRFSGKVAVITGSTMGIGLAIAERLGIEGATVVISSRKQSNVDSALKYLRSKNISCYGKTCHAGKESHNKELISYVISKCGRLDICIPNAATNPFFGSFLKGENSHWDKILSVNVKGPFFLVKYSAPHLIKSCGTVVLISSIGGYDLHNPTGIYNISKTAILGMTQILNKELGPKGVRVNCLAPGLIPTKFSKALVENKTIRDLSIAKTTLKRLGTVQECAGTVAFLCSDDAGYIAGETIVVAGGQRSRL